MKKTFLGKFRPGFVGSGTGKMSAFAMRELGFKKVLFLVHRNQIAKQALKLYRKVFGGKVKMGMVTGKHQDYDADFIFATVQTLSKEENLLKLPKDYFECCVYDEAHHTAADSYKEPDKLILENPGYIRTGKVQMRKGGESDPRNKSLMKMFNLINIGERSGSGVPNIFNTWEDKGWKEPVIEERFDPDRTILTLEFVEKQAIKISDKKQAKKTSDKKQAKKTAGNKEKIRKFLMENGLSKTSDIADYLDLSPARTRAILSEMEEIEFVGENRNRKYRIRQ